ncbi:MAG: polysaccharide deacetylase family protein, partial [Bacteroidia bacterium]
FRYLSTIDVDNVYAYKAKPFSRSLGASAKDFLNLNFQSIGDRIKTLYFFKKDPFDAYDLQIELSEKYKIPLMYFFLCRTDTEHDRTIDPKHPAFAKLLKEITKKNVAVGAHPSYFSSSDTALFGHETRLLKDLSGQNVPFSRQHYLRFDVGSTPQHLIDAGIKYDFTMGYASDIGFRAGTSLPFYYFDFEKNKPLPLLAVPFEVMDGAFYTYNAVLPKQAEKETMAIVEEVQKVNGLFITVFHDRTFGTNFFPGWKPMYLRLQERLRNDV